MIVRGIHRIPERVLSIEILGAALQIKTQEELEIMQYANDIASAAHVEVSALRLLSSILLLPCWCDLGP